MLINWTDQAAKWFEDASAYTGYHQKVAQLLLPYLDQTATLCDLGCGIGLIDEALAGHISQITGVDANENAIDYMTKMMKRKDITNITPICGDARQLQGLWDTVLMVFFGKLEEDLDHYLTLAQKQVIAIVHNDPAPGSNQQPKCNTVSLMKKLLAEKNLAYELIEKGLEYGQPFTSLDEGVAYIKAYRKQVPKGQEEAYFKQKTTLTGREDFPYYLPHTKAFGIFIIRRK